MRKSVAASALLALGLLAFALPPLQDGGNAAARAKELLAPFAGNWDTEWSGMGMPPSQGSEVVTALPHGLALVITSTSPMGPGQTFEGHGLIGFDRGTGKFMHAWADNQGPGLSISEGRFSEDGKSFIIEAEQDMGMGPVKTVMTMHVDDADHMTWTMRAKDAPADAAPMMTQKYTRKR